MQGTHEEARNLIQFSLDASLNSNQQAWLSAHLEHCVACRDYAQDMKRVEFVLTQAGQTQRERQHVPLSIPVLMTKGTKRVFDRTLLTMRSSILAIVFVALAFSTWSFFSVSPSSTPGAVPAPTPSGQSTSTEVLFADCQLVRYSVREQDTLASLAERFSITEDEIIALNDLENSSLDAAQLWLPICNFTPTVTAQVPAPLTKTHTPILDPITPGPGG
jgi:hypothetical protein